MRLIDDDTGKNAFDGNFEIWNNRLTQMIVLVGLIYNIIYTNASLYSPIVIASVT